MTARRVPYHWMQTYHCCFLVGRCGFSTDDCYCFPSRYDVSVKGFFPAGVDTKVVRKNRTEEFCEDERVHGEFAAYASRHKRGATRNNEQFHQNKAAELNDVGRTSLHRGFARGPRGPIPRSSIQERNERETKGITISDRTTMITPTKGHRHATQLRLLQSPC